MARYQESSQQDLHQLLKEKDRQLLEYQETIAHKNELLLAKEREVDQLATRLDQATQENHTFRYEVGAREEQLRTLHCELQSSEENCAALQQTIQQRDREVSELRQELTSRNERVITTRMHHVALQDKRQKPSMRPITVGRWESLPNPPVKMSYRSSAVIGDKTYFKSRGNNTVYEFSDNQWNKLPSCPNNDCTIVSVDDMLTTVGGGLVFSSNELHSYIDNQWVKHFPPMPTKRWYPTAVYTHNTLVVAGGENIVLLLTTVEILNNANRQWSSVSSLPVKMRDPSTTICGDYVYIHPCTDDQEKNSVYKCSLEQLVQSQPRSAIWEKITSLPVSYSSLVTVNGHLLAVSGKEANDRTMNIYQYINTSWTVVGQMTSSQSLPTTAVLPGNKLMVVGRSHALKQCEIATIT